MSLQSLVSFLILLQHRALIHTSTTHSDHERKMVKPSPGSLIQYKASGTSLPPWPAVICTDDMAPQEMQRSRPHGYFYVTLILLLDERFEL